MDLRFRFDLTHKNDRNSLNFLDRRLIFWTFSYLYVFKKSYLKTSSLRPIFKFSLFSGLKRFELKFRQNFILWCLRKVKKFYGILPTKKMVIAKRNRCGFLFFFLLFLLWQGKTKSIPTPTNWSWVRSASLEWSLTI